MARRLIQWSVAKKGAGFVPTNLRFAAPEIEVTIDASNLQRLTTTMEGKQKSVVVLANNHLVKRIRQEINRKYKKPLKFRRKTFRQGYDKGKAGMMLGQPIPGTGYAYWSGAYKSAWRTKTLHSSRTKSEKLTYLDERVTNPYMVGLGKTPTQERPYYYARFVEYGTSLMEAKPVLKPAVDKAVPEAMIEIRRLFSRSLNADIAHRPTI